MDPVHERIQADLWWFTWIAFALALPLYAFLRQRDPLIRWHEHGNVATKAFDARDLALVLVFFFGLKLAMMGAMAQRSPADPTSFTATLMLTDMLLKIALASFFVYFLMFRKVNVIEVFGLNRLSPMGVLIWGGVVGVLAVPLVMAVGHVSAMALEGTLGKLPRQPIVEAFTENGAWSFRLVTIVGVVVVTPVFEELFYRGYLYGVTKRFSDRFFAALFSSLLFTIAHSGVITVIPILTLAVFLVLAYELSGSLWVPMVIHVLFNLANVVGMLLLPAAG